jgi:hypothetical protein
MATQTSQDILNAQEAGVPRFYRLCEMLRIYNHKLIAFYVNTNQEIRAILSDLVTEAGYTLRLLGNGRLWTVAVLNMV